MGKSWIWVILALVLVAGAAACSASQGNPAIPAPPPASATSSAAASTTAADTAVRSGGVAGSLPNYQPSKVISEAVGGIRLSSIDPVSKVVSFYENILKSRGWRITSIATSGATTTIVAMRGSTGVGILISRADPVGTSISVFQCDC